MISSHSLHFSDLDDLCQQLDTLKDNEACIEGDQILIQLFSDQTPEQVTAFSQVLHHRFPSATLIGSSAAHTIKDGAIHHQQTTIVITTFENTRFTAAISAYQSDYGITGEHLHAQLKLEADTKAVICFGDRMNSNRHDHRLFTLFSGTDIPVSGGSSVITDNGRWVMLNGEIYTHALVAVALHGHDLHAYTKAFTEWNPIGQKFVITKTNSYGVEELNHQPILKVYQRYLADGDIFPAEKLGDFPLMRGEQRNQHLYRPQNLLEDGTLVFDEALSVGDEVRFCYDHPDLTIQQVKQAAYQMAMDTLDQIFIYNCTSRLDFIEGNSELTPLQTVTDCHGFYCMGELFKDGDQQKILHHSMTLLALREGEARSVTVEPQYDLTTSISPLFSMIRNSFEDLNKMHHAMQEKINHQAQQLISSYRIDRKTGLPNRAVLKEQISAMKLDEHLLIVKIDNFDKINEKYGYGTGDKLLKVLSLHFADMIPVYLAQDSSLYTMGVGEWATIFASDRPVNEIVSIFNAFAEQVEGMDYHTLGLPEGGFITLSISGGLVRRKDFPLSDADDMLLKGVDARRWAAKNNRALCNARFLKDREEERIEHLNWLSIANKAVLSDNVIAYAQPIFEASTKQISSLECLVRLQHEGEIILPGKFLPVIEGTRLYTRLSQQMITRTMEAMRTRSERFSINLSAQDMLNSKTIKLLEQELLTLDDPSRLGIEILESEQIEDFGRMSEICTHFRSFGASIIVDDFGSGYSNLDEIIKLEPDVIKLDGSLIRNIDQDPKQRKVTKQLVKLCRALDAQTVAEFVHNQQVCDIAIDLGVDYLQGFYLAKPHAL